MYQRWCEALRRKLSSAKRLPPERRELTVRELRNETGKVLFAHIYTFNSNLGFSVDGGWRFINLQASCMWGIPKNSGSVEGSSWENTSFPGIMTRQYTADVKIVGGLSAGLLFNFFLRLGSKHLCPLPL